MNQRLDLQYYEILGLTPSASLEEVEHAYKKACDIYSQNNPEFVDSFDDKEAQELKGWVDEAYNMLVDKLKNQTQFLEQMLQSKNEVLQALEAKPIECTSMESKHKFQFEQDEDEATQAEEEELLEATEFFDGLTLKKIRLKKNISLNYISNKTCIGVHHLIAIEANDFSSLPAGVFVRSYVKQISQILGLKTKDVAESYMKLYSEARGDI